MSQELLVEGGLLLIHRSLGLLSKLQGSFVLQHEVLCGLHYLLLHLSLRTDFRLLIVATFVYFINSLHFRNFDIQAFSLPLSFVKQFWEVFDLRLDKADFILVGFGGVLGRLDFILHNNLLKV